jgi:hypothetical protein
MLPPVREIRSLGACRSGLCEPDQARHSDLSNTSDRLIGLSFAVSSRGAMIGLLLMA